MKADSARSLLLTLAILVPLAAPSNAHLALIRQGAESGGAKEALDRHGQVLCVGDFNGDGFEDLATGVPYEDYSSWPGSDHGAVIINFGSPEGLTHIGAQVIAPPINEHAMLFGWSLASADFENDGFDELVVGAPYANTFGNSDSGVIAVYRGGVLGFVNPPVLYDQTDIGSAAEAGDQWGWALAADDIDADGYADLCVGSPGENGASGSVVFMFGGATGLSTAGSYGYTQGHIGTGSSANERFGSSIVIGNFTGLNPLPPLQNPKDVAIGCPYEGIGLISGNGSTGMVAVLGSTNTGPKSSLVQVHTPASLGISSGGDRAFGFALAAGDFDQNGYDDLAVGRPGGNSYAGEVVELHGSAVGLSYNSVRTANDHLANGAQVGDRFGWSLATGDFDEDSYDDLLVGSPNHTQLIFQNCGRVYVYRSTNGLGLASWQDFQQSDLNVDFESFQEVGYSVAMGFFDDTGRANFVAGAPGAEGNAGRVHVMAPWRQPGPMSCRNAVQFDCDGNFVYSLKPFDPVYIASTAKNMTILIACERTQLPTSDPSYVSPNAQYIVPKWVSDNVGGSQFHLVEGELVTLRTLMDMTMSVSGNDAAFAIADLLTGSNAVWNGLFGTVNTFVAEMNVRAAQLGMSSTTFTNPAGFPDKINEESTPYDISILGRAAIANPLFEAVVNNKEWWIPRNIPTLQGGFYSYTQYQSGGFVNALQSVFPLAIGSKDGGSPTSGITAVFQAREEYYPWGIPYGSLFNTPSVAQWVGPDAAALLEIGMNRCFTGPITAQPVEQPPTPVVASALNDNHFSFVPPDPLAKEVELELFNLVQDGLPTEVRMEVERESTAAIGDLETAYWRTDNVSGHDGITIVYEGDQFANLFIQTDAVGNPSFTPTMGPGDVLEIPAASLPSGQTDFTMSVFVSSALGSVRVTERYGEDLVLGDESNGLPQSAAIKFDQTSQVEVTPVRYGVDLIGQDTDPGHEVGLALHDGDLGEFNATPAHWENYGAGWPGTHGVPTFTLDDTPVQGHPFRYRFGNSLHEDTVGVWFMGLQENDLPTTLGGTLNVKQVILKVTFPLPAEGYEFPTVALPDPALAGIAFLHQLFVVDPGASDGFAFSRGVRTTLGS